MITSLVSALRTNLEYFSDAAQRASRPEQNDLPQAMSDLIVAQHAAEASIAALHQLSQLERQLIDLYA